MAQEIDIESPLSLLASAEGAKDYTFYLVLPKPSYTPDAFEKNPNVVAGPDLLFKSPVVPDADGRAHVDLKPKAKEIKDKLKDPETKVKGVLLATEKAPLARKKCVMEDFVIRKPGSIKLAAIRAFASPQQWAAYHHAVCFIALEVKGPIPEVMIDTQPKPYNVAPGITGIWEPVAPGKADPKKMVEGSLGDPHAPNAGCRFPSSMHGDLKLWCRCFGDGHHTKVKLPAGVENFVIGLYPRATGTCVLKVSGTEKFSSISDTIQFGFNGAHPHPGD